MTTERPVYCYRCVYCQRLFKAIAELLEHEQYLCKDRRTMEARWQRAREAFVSARQ